MVRTKSEMFNSETIKRLINALVFILSLFLATINYAQDQESFWPQFHGPNRDNISTEKRALEEVAEEWPYSTMENQGAGAWIF
jgi:hypothetical protein